MKYWHKGQLGKTIAEHQANVQKINEDFGFDETTTLKWKYTIIFFAGDDTTTYSDRECKNLTKNYKDGFFIRKILERVAPSDYEIRNRSMSPLTKKWMALRKVPDVITHLEQSCELREFNIDWFDNNPDPAKTSTERAIDRESHVRILLCIRQAVKRLKHIQIVAHALMEPLFQTDQNKAATRGYEPLFQVITNRPKDPNDAESAGIDLRGSDLTAGGLATAPSDAESAGIDLRGSDLTPGGFGEYAGTVTAGGLATAPSQMHHTVQTDENGAAETANPTRQRLIRKDSGDVDPAGINFPRQQRARAGNGQPANVTAGADDDHGDDAADSANQEDPGDLPWENPNFKEGDWRRYLPPEIDKGSEKPFASMTDKQQKKHLEELCGTRNRLADMNLKLKEDRKTQKSNATNVREIHDQIHKNEVKIKGIDKQLADYKPKVKNTQECKPFFEPYVPRKHQPKTPQKGRMRGSGVIVEPPDHAQSLIDNLNYLKKEFDEENYGARESRITTVEPNRMTGMIAKDLMNFLIENRCSMELLTKIKTSDWRCILYRDSSKLCILTLFAFSDLDDIKIGIMNLTTQQEEEIKRLMLKAKKVLKKRKEQFDKKYPFPRTSDNPSRTTHFTGGTAPTQTISYGYVEALADALNNSDSDLWDTDTAAEQVREAQKHLSALQNKPPSERGMNFYPYTSVLKLLIKSVQDKLEGDVSYGTFTPA
jgi:hypothetical protein